LLLRRELLRHRDLYLHELIASHTTLLDALPLDPELPARLRAGRNPQHHFLAVERAHPKPGAERGLGDVERHLADDVEPLAMKEAVGLDLEGDDQVAWRGAGLSVLTLPAHAHPGAGLGRRR